MSQEWPAMPVEIQAQAARMFQALAKYIQGGQISCFAICTIGVNGVPQSGTAAHFNSDIAHMVRDIVNNHMKCECGDPTGTTELTRLSIVQLLEAYLAGGKPRPQGAC